MSYSSLREAQLYEQSHSQQVVPPPGWFGSGQCLMQRQFGMGAGLGAGVDAGLGAGVDAGLSANVKRAVAPQPEAS